MLNASFELDGVLRGVGMAPPIHRPTPAPSPHMTSGTHGSVTLTQPDLRPPMPTKLVHKVATPASCASVDRERHLCLITPMGRATPWHKTPIGCVALHRVGRH